MQTVAREVFMNLLQVDKTQSHELCDWLRLFGDEALSFIWQGCCYSFLLQQRLLLDNIIRVPQK